ncbi:ribonuclease H-like domain-containing protein [Aspergillus insuetus]
MDPLEAFKEIDGLYNHTTGTGNRWRSIPLEDRASVAAQLADFRYTPEELREANGRLSTPKRFIVAIDCEMIGLEDPDNFEGEIERLAQLVAIDVLTGDILVDVLVKPNGPVKHYRTEHSGLKEESFVEAKGKRKLVKRVDLARQRLFKWIDQDTILVGHGLQSDFRALEIRHNGVDTHNKVNVIDTQIVARKEVERMIAIQPRWKTGRPPRGKTKLKHLAESLCGQTIQADLINGHDCVEDTYATREVLLAMEHSRLDLEDWATEYVRRSTISASWTGL